jgi:hypothetical protein
MPEVMKPTYLELYPTSMETYLMASRMAIERLDGLVDPSLGYKRQEVYELLRDKTGMIRTLWMIGLPSLHPAAAQFTSVQAILHNLWRNGMIRKFAKRRDVYTLSGRHVGILWVFQRSIYV